MKAAQAAFHPMKNIIKWYLGILLVAFSQKVSAQKYSLNYFIEQAKAHSPALIDLQNQMTTVGLDSQILRASLRTQINFLGSFSYAPIIQGFGYDEAITNIANLTGIIQANRNYISKNNLGLQLQSIALQRRGLLDTMQISQQDLIRTVTEQYITSYGDMLALDFNKEVYDLLKSEEQILKKLTEASVYKQTDYLNFYVTMQQQELAYLQSRIQYNTDYLTLDYLAGIVDTAIQRIQAPQLPDSLLTDVSGSVFHRKFITDSLRLANERALIEYEYKPRIGGYIDGGYNSSLQNTPYKNFGGSVGLSVTIPLYDGGQRQLKVAKIDVREKTRSANKDFFLRQRQQQIQQLRSQLLQLNMVTESINRQIQYTRTLIDANGKLLQTGDITMKDYITALNIYLNARNLLTQNNISRLRILNQLNYWNR